MPAIQLHHIENGVIIDGAVNMNVGSEGSMVEKLPAYSSTASRPAEMMEKGSECKVEIVITKTETATNEKKKGGILHGLGEVYDGKNQFCPLTGEVIPAPFAAWVFSLVYILLHLGWVVKLSSGPVRAAHHLDATGRAVLMCVAGVHVVCMTAAFVGIWCGCRRLMMPFIFVHAKETGLLTIGLLCVFCVPFLHIIWCVVTWAGDPFEMFTKEGMEIFCVVVLVCVFAHLVLALFVRAAHNLDVTIE